MINFLFLKTPLAYFVQPIWRDEAFSYLLAKRNLGEIIFLTARDFNPPLYYLLLHLWIKFFGSSEIALRLPSLIFFWATLFVVFLFLNNILKLSLKKSFFYLVLFIANPLLNYYAFEARMYTMFAFLAALSFYAFWQKNKNLYLWATLLGIFTHYFMIFVILAQILIYFLNRDYYLSPKNLIKPILFFLPWLIFVFIVKKPLFSSFWSKPLELKNLALVPTIIYTGYEFEFNFLKNSISWFVWFFLIFLFYVLILNRLTVKKRDKLLINFLSIWSIVIPFFIALISLYQPIFIPRYLIFANVGLILLTILALENLPFLIRIIILIFLLNQTWQYNQTQIAKRKKADLRKTIKEIKLLSKKDDLVYVTDILDYFPICYYFGEKRVFIYKKNYDEIPDYVGKTLIPKEKIVSTLPIYPKKAFIINDINYYQIQSSL